MSFAGFPPGLIGFYRGLAADNSHAHWDANKAAVRERVREAWRGAQPLKDRLDAHVGASDEPARRRPAGDRSGTEKRRTPSRP